MLERFTVDGLVDAIRKHRITRSGVQPAVIRMLLDADVPKEDLASLEFLISASGPLDPETRDEFEQHYGIPVRLAYGATEFAGSLCAWTPDLLRRVRGRPNATASAGLCPIPSCASSTRRPAPNCPSGEQGLLEAKVAPLGPDWIRTTDIASVDAEGFVTLHGRADGAINRGGFKILPETVRRVLISHPAVRDACVVGVPDTRLGQVPFAAIEVVAGHACAIRRRTQRPGAPVISRVQRAGGLRGGRRSATQPGTEGQPAGGRRALRARAEKGSSARGVLAVVVHRRLTSR